MMLTPEGEQSAERYEVKRFTPEAKKQLEDMGFTIVKLPQLSIQEMTANGQKNSLRVTFPPTDPSAQLAEQMLYGSKTNFPTKEDVYSASRSTSPSMEVAVNLDNFFLEESADKSYDEQLDMLSEYWKKFDNIKNSDGSRATSVTLGTPARYAELTYALAQTGKYEDYAPFTEFPSIRTAGTTESGDTWVVAPQEMIKPAKVSPDASRLAKLFRDIYSQTVGLDMYNVPKTYKSPTLFIAPLVVPA